MAAKILVLRKLLIFGFVIEGYFSELVRWMQHNFCCKELFIYLTEKSTEPEGKCKCSCQMV